LLGHPLSIPYIFLRDSLGSLLWCVLARDIDRVFKQLVRPCLANSPP